MTLTKSIKLLPTVEQEHLIASTLCEYIRCVNELLDMMYMFNEFGRLSSKNVDANLPSAIKNQCIQDAKSIYKKFLRGKVQSLPVLRKSCAMWNNQNFSIFENYISFPVWKDSKSTRIKVKALIPADLYAFLSTHKLGSLRLTYKNHKLIAQVAVEAPASVSTDDGIMGVDLGIKCPAVCYTNKGKVKFFGNGRYNKVLRRRYKTKRRKLGKLKKPNAIKTINHKEQRIMRDIDHKLSRSIVNFAIDNGIKTIRMERLGNIRSSTRKSRKNEPYLHTWSFYRLMQYITYKAELMGIAVELVNPAYTSQKCPICGCLNKVKDRNYVCSCGYHSHRDVVGAINICIN